MDTPPWYVLGAGALGGLWAARLARGGVAVCLLVRDPAAYADGLVLEDAAGTQRLALPAERIDAAGAPIARLLLTVKAHQTRAAFAAVAPRLAPGAVIVLLQNGMGAADALVADGPAHAPLLATTTLGAWRRAPAHVVHAGDGPTWLGPGPRAASAAQRAAALDGLRASGFAVDWDDAIEARLWDKLAVNAAINPLTALLDCRNGALAEHAEGRALVSALCAETSAAFTALGRPATALAERVLAVAAATAGNVSSMCADVRAGRPTEIDFITGHLVARAAALGLELPRHRLLLEMIRLKTALAAPVDA